VDSIALSCKLCDAGYYFVENSEICLNFAPTGYKLVDLAEYETEQTTLAKF
jgi:hypothetical protein